MSDLQRDLNLLLAELQPQSLLLVGDCPALQGQPEHSEHLPCPVSLAALQGVGRFELVIANRVLANLDKATAEQVLGRLRNLHARHLLLLHPKESDWQAQDFIAFAMTRLRDYADCTLYEYNLHSYKAVPDWLNSQFWANPNQWDKYRW